STCYNRTVPFPLPETRDFPPLFNRLQSGSQLRSNSCPTTRSVTVKQFDDLNPLKKSNVRVNDEIIPKPTDINVGEKQIKVSIQRQHPYQSHISFCALFPTYHSPDDPDTGVRAASKLPINPLLPANASKVILLSKTKGAAYRHELLDIPMETRRNVAIWPGQSGFQNHIKPVKGDTQEFYPQPLKTLCPNQTLRDWKNTLLERTANALRNLEKSQWLTSYQLNYTGSGPTNPIKLDDFNEKTISLITGEMNPYTAQLRERSYPVLMPSQPLEGCRARILQNQCRLENPCSIMHPLSFPPEPQDVGMTAERNPMLDNMQHKPYIANQTDEVIKYNQVSKSGQTRQVVFNNTANMCCKRSCVYKISESNGSKPQTNINKPASRVIETESTQLDLHNFQAALQEKETNKRALSNNRIQNYVVENSPFEFKCTAPPSAYETDRPVNFEQTKKDFEEEEKIKQGSCLIPSIRPRFSRGTTGYGVKRISRDLGSDLLELHDSFSRTKANRNFRESLQDAPVDLRENLHTGRKHFFYGFNSYYFHN
ncbi:uncharacterized protein C7orf31, partial [Silurus meridionalis]|uniref:uncharacterized protein C7orf31 n=1 Tax=Silurus meridionalis TaxID=175797 RepID=UPI001EE9B3DF